MFLYEFHVSRASRTKYKFDDDLFSVNGRVVSANFPAARRFAEIMSRERGIPVPASDINAMGLIDEAFHLLIRAYENNHPKLMQEALDRSGRVDDTFLRFTEDFPPNIVYRGMESPKEYLAGLTNGISHQQITLEELLMLKLANINPAYTDYRELFTDTELQKETQYDRIIGNLRIYLGEKPGFSTGEESLYDLLITPMRIAPHSLLGQLQYIATRWGHLLGESFLINLLRGIDFSKEEVLRGNFAGGFAGDAPVLTFNPGDNEYERFSPDKDWMPRCVLIAKNTYVWLEQLSRKYQRWIKTLDQIPDDELDILANRGFTGLWLIGLWERSYASRQIKQILGDMDAVASAYSLYNYDIAADLGGWSALENIRARAWHRGIRLSADMVPNHMGIDSQWMIEHPDWFLSLPYAPYPSYSFNGPDLSTDARVGIQLEDHYYSRSDAAVVFKRFDHHSGETRFVYHGNDGTSMPWNDTAQLDYSSNTVREAVIQTILHVARNFPIIRFDAAMTLAKKHIQRLWFPEPGAGGAIPSRAEHGMTRAQFEAAMPEEFWRQVVDRVAAEVPDTLLLAEAFWLMEGYFVRTLGMHRVYNSAFMHMLRDEDNAKYRSVIKNVLEFDPQVIKRFVNFMNNPDEKTAIEQFGDGDKYFGVCTLLVTLPGLPMFGHGQVEGFHEKYGMEFRKPKWDETPNVGLLRGHEWRIFPLLHRRWVYADSLNFLLYDFFTSVGTVNENVFAYSNRVNDERGLVIYHNKYARTNGWIRTSAAYMDKGTENLMQKTLSDGLGIPDDGYAIFRDLVDHKEYIRPCKELNEKGLYVDLGGYQCHVFMDWHFVTGENWGTICNQLNGKGVESMQNNFDEIYSTVTEKTTKSAPPVKRKGKVPSKRTSKAGKSKYAKPESTKKTH